MDAIFYSYKFPHGQLFVDIWLSSMPVGERMTLFLSKNDLMLLKKEFASRKYSVRTFETSPKKIYSDLKRINVSQATSRPNTIVVDVKEIANLIETSKPVQYVSLPKHRSINGTFKPTVTQNSYDASRSARIEVFEINRHTDIERNEYSGNVATFPKLDELSRKNTEHSSYTQFSGTFLDTYERWKSLQKDGYFVDISAGRGGLKVSGWDGLRDSRDMPSSINRYEINNLTHDQIVFAELKWPIQREIIRETRARLGHQY